MQTILSHFEHQVEELPLEQRLIGRPIIATAKLIGAYDLQIAALRESVCGAWRNPRTAINLAGAADHFESMKHAINLAMEQLRPIVMSQTHGVEPEIMSMHS